jgi:hypothetical protein
MRAAASTPAAHPPARRPSPARLFLLLGIAIGGGLFFAWRHGSSGATADGRAALAGTDGRVRIAVLPFETWATRPMRTSPMA